MPQAIRPAFIELVRALIRNYSRVYGVLDALVKAGNTLNVLVGGGPDEGIYPDTVMFTAQGELYWSFRIRGHAVTILNPHMVLVRPCGEPVAGRFYIAPEGLQ